MKYTKADDARYRRLLASLEEDARIQRLRAIPQHRGNNTFAHCHDVARMSYALARRSGIRVDMKALARSAMLHDYYLYDTRTMPYSAYRHALLHPRLAVQNAAGPFALTDKEKAAILSHMWPIPGSPMPRCREAWLLCLADKLCALREMARGKGPLK